MTDFCSALCTGCIDKIEIPNCGDTDLGKAIVKIFIQKVSGTGFDDEADLSLEASWQSKMAIADYGDCDDRIVSIGFLHDGVIPDGDQATIIAPFGGQELINMTNTVTFKIKRYNANLIEAIDKLRCLNAVNFWFLTDKLYLFGGLKGYTNASIAWGNYAMEGFDNKSGSNNTVTWTGIQQHKPVLNTFLEDMTNPS